MASSLTNTSTYLVYLSFYRYFILCDRQPYMNPSHLQPKKVFEKSVCKEQSIKSGGLRRLESTMYLFSTPEEPRLTHPTGLTQLK
ncbi:MAG: hypothetical protein AB4426_14315 [Xenococcaceae cyanobacterium]